MSNPVLAANLVATEILRSRLVLQLGLEASLEKSLLALRALNLSGLVIETREQIALSCSLAVLDDPNRSVAERGAETAPPGTIRVNTLAQLRASALRIRFAGRLQLAVLARLQHKLRVMTNMLAGTSVAYSSSTVTTQHPWCKS